jgi:hypothetical protein
MLDLRIVGKLANRWHGDEQHSKRRKMESKRIAVEIMANYVVCAPFLPGLPSSFLCDPQTKPIRVAVQASSRTYATIPVQVELVLIYPFSLG